MTLTTRAPRQRACHAVLLDGGQIVTTIVVPGPPPPEILLPVFRPPSLFTGPHADISALAIPPVAFQTYRRRGMLYHDYPTFDVIYDRVSREFRRASVDVYNRPSSLYPDAPATDHATQELVTLARAGDRAGFEALAQCLMPVEDVAPCWTGTRQRLGLAP